MSPERLIESLLPAHGEEAEPRRVQDSIQKTLSLDAVATKELVRGLSAVEFKGYQGICTVMAKQHKQWSRTLLLELPLENLSGEKLSPNSSLKAAGPLDNSPKAVLDQALLRSQYLKLLYDELRPSEKDAYPQLLAVTNMPKDLPADAAAGLTLYGLDAVFHDAFLEEERYFLDKHDLDACPIHGVRPLAQFVGGFVFDFVANILAKVPPTATDSLAARLILNSVLNRAILEIDELQRLSNDATSTLSRMLTFLETIIPEGLPPAESASDIQRTLMAVFGCPGPAFDDAKWRPLEERVVGKILARSGGMLDYYCTSRSNGNEADFRALHQTWDNLLLMALTVAWTHCMVEKLDLGVPGLKNRSVEVMGGRVKEEGLSLPTAVSEYQCRLYGNLYYSSQLDQLNLASLQTYQDAFSHKRNQMRRIYVDLLKSASLAQWNALAGHPQIDARKPKFD